MDSLMECPGSKYEGDAKFASYKILLRVSYWWRDATFLKVDFGPLSNIFFLLNSINK